jgi:hypothetical protein
MEQGETGSPESNQGPQRVEADQALMTAHSLLLNVLDLQMDHFKIEALEKPLEQCFQDFQDIWKRDGHNRQTGR